MDRIFFTNNLININKENIADKLNKRYHGSDRALVIVIYDASTAEIIDGVKELNKRFNKDHDNVRIITIDQYIEYLGMTGEYLTAIKDVDAKATLARTMKTFQALAAYEELKNKKIEWKSNLDALGLPRELSLFIEKLPRRLVTSESPYSGKVLPRKSGGMDKFL